MATAIPLLLFVLINGGLSFQSSYSGISTHSRVTLTKLSKSITEGFYFDAVSKEGLKFSTRHNEELSVTTATGRALIRVSPTFKVERIEEDGTKGFIEIGLAQIAGHYFVREKDREKETDYYITSADALLLSNSILSQVTMETLDVKTLDSLLEGVDKTDQSHHSEGASRAISSLLSDQSYPLLVDMVHYIGERLGLTGDKYPSLLRLYLVVMNLERAAGKGAKPPEPKTSLSRYYESYILRGISLPSSLECLRTCPNPCTDNSCLGMCGPGCTCWKFACGDCCYHYGCFKHDLACRNCGLRHVKCILGALKVYAGCRSKTVPELSDAC
uniref:Uncharacterized protein n=1 Tax=Amphimedon queenslandica TaxID=400682 RepID=A0A1X7U7X1_AMPQE